jgi:methanogenic corrinoid protein MtbC1
LPQLALLSPSSHTRTTSTIKKQEKGTIIAGAVAEQVHELGKKKVI